MYYAWRFIDGMISYHDDIEPFLREGYNFEKIIFTGKVVYLLSRKNIAEKETGIAISIVEQISVKSEFKQAKGLKNLFFKQVFMLVKRKFSNSRKSIKEINGRIRFSEPKQILEFQLS